jgi:4-hydroxy-2-oxovalerate aldolase
MNGASPQILECTLRDGSYAINFQFTAIYTRLVTAALERVGFRLIEVGHGIGLGANEAGMGKAAATDEAYMRAASDAVEKAKVGVFCIPGIARLDHVDLAADCGMGFIRIGTNVTEVSESRAFIERAKKFGLMVCANFMKSYAMAPAEFGTVVNQSAAYGADVVYVVDSAGGMLAEDVRAYCEAARSASDVTLGFHGHHNLGLAVSNALLAADCGATIVDTSLQGMGRSAGNTSTEQFLCLLLRRGVNLGIDPIAVMDLGESLIQPLMEDNRLPSLDVVSGLAQFHSSYMTVIRRFADRYRVDPRRLILAVTACDRVHAPEALVEREAKRLAADAAPVRAGVARQRLDNYFGAEHL